MGQCSTKAEKVGEAYLALLADRGINYLFGNSGTEFPSIIEALTGRIGMSSLANR